MEMVYLLLGSNMGDRRENLKQAVALLGGETGRVIGQSGIYESPPWGFDAQEAFLNQAVALETAMQPRPLLDHLHELEARLGRRRSPFESGCGCGIGAGTGDGYESRTMDIDILFYGNRLIFDDRLMVPHPRLHERRFALMPMAEIAPDFVHPVLKKTIFALLTACADPLSVKLIA